jgi:calmodulin
MVSDMVVPSDLPQLQSKRSQIKRGESQGILNDEQVEELRLAFDLFDSDGKGYLKKDDLRAVLDKFGLIFFKVVLTFSTGFTKASSKEVDDMFNEAEINSSGKIEFTEFMTMMAKKMKMVI